MTYFERIDSIYTTLMGWGIPCSVRPIWDGYQLRLPWCDGDVACHFGTYGSDRGMVETYRFPWDEDDVSVLTPTKPPAELSISINPNDYTALTARVQARTFVMGRAGSPFTDC